MSQGEPSTSLPDVPDALVRLATAAEDVGKVDIVQSLWSGYGNIYRCALLGGLRPSVVVKHVRWPSEQRHPRGWNSDVSHNRKVRSYEVETYWYQHVARRSVQAGARVPDCLAVVSHGEETVMVLEDLDASGFGIRRKHVSTEEMHACLRWLARFHAGFLGAATDGLWEVGTYWHLETRPEEFSALPPGELRDAAPKIDALLSGVRHKTVVHGDAKLANFCFSEDGDVAAVDFQYVGGGCGIKDVAYFLSSCLSESECEERESELLDVYFAELRRALLEFDWDVNPDELEAEWRSMYPVAWTDFYRFLKGWSPGHWKIHRYTERLAAHVLASL